MEIIVSGSLAYDHIMDFPGYFKEHILPDKVHILNVSFLVNSLKKLKGGCAGNIAYNLALLGEHPAILGTVGEDFKTYQHWLEKKGIETSSIKVIPDEFTASCFITTDLSDNQIIGFYPGAMQYAHTLSFKELDHHKIKIAIISPNDPQAMIKYVKECKELEITYIFDPGHQIPRMSPEDLINGMNGSKMTIVNDYEFQMILNRADLTEEEILKLTEILVVTKGAQGSIIKTKDEFYDISPAHSKEVIDPTGAGDAYRAGIIKGLLKGYSYQEMGYLASLAAVYAVEKYGTTEHYFTLADIKKRYLENYISKVPS